MNYRFLFTIFVVVLSPLNFLFSNNKIKSPHKEKIIEIEKRLPDHAKEYTQILLSSDDVKEQLNACGALVGSLLNDAHDIRLYFITLTEELARKNGFDRPLAYSMLNRALIYLEQSKIKAGDSLLTIAGEFAQRINYPIVLAESYSIRAYCAYAVADYHLGIELAQKAIETIRSNDKITTLERETGTAGAMTQMGSCYLELGDFENAVINFTNALIVFEKNEAIPTQISLLHNLANCYLRQGNDTASIEYSHRCLTLLEGQPNNNIRASVFNVLGGVYEERNQLDSALIYFNNCIKAYNELDMPDHLATAYTNTGDVYLKASQPEKCIEFTQKALAIVENQNSHAVVIPIYLNLAKAYAELDDFDKSFKYLGICLNLTDESSSNDYRRRTLKTYSDIYYEKGDTESAYIYFQRFYEMDKKIFGAEREKEIQQIRLRYETDRTEAELKQQRVTTKLQATEITLNRIGLIALIMIIGLFITLYFQINKRNKALDQANRTEILLRKETEHRVKNHLQMVSAFFRLHSHSVNNESAKQLVKEGKNRIEAVGLLHQKLQIKKDHPGTINIKGYIDDLTSNLLLSLDPRSNIVFNSQVDDIELDADQAVKLGLIINELISNSIKHFPDDLKMPSLSLILEKREDIYLRIQDNGQGLPTDFSTRKNKSFGIRLVELMAKQLHGEFSFHSNLGTCFELKYKYPS